MVILLGVGIAANAQKCKIAKDGTYVTVEPSIVKGTDYITCVATVHGQTVPATGTLKVKVFYETEDAKEGYEIIPIKWDKVNKDILVSSTARDGKFAGKTKKIKKIKSWEIEAETTR